MTTKICIDIRYLTKKSSGVGRYIKNLTEHLILEAGDSFKYFLLGQKENFQQLELDSSSYQQIKSPCSPENHPETDLWYNFSFPNILKKKEINIFHATSFIAPVRKLPCALITTIFDRATKIMPETMPALFRYYLNFHVRFAIKQSNRIITISRQIKNELRNEFKSAPPIHAVHLGYTQKQINIDTSFQQHTPFILYVGNIEPRKGITDLIKSFERFKEHNKNSKLNLIICGQTLWNFTKPKQMTDRSEFKNSIIFTGYVSEQILSGLYHLSKLTVIPSYYEGFGLPVLEAMKANAPILINDIPVLREVGGSIVYLTDIGDHEQSAFRIKELLNEEIQTINRADQYAAHLEKFTWKNCARETRKIYEELSS